MNYNAKNNLTFVLLLFKKCGYQKILNQYVTHIIFLLDSLGLEVK